VGETGQPIKFGGVGRGICEDVIFGKEHFSKKTSFFRKRAQEIGAIRFLTQIPFLEELRILFTRKSLQNRWNSGPSSS